MEIIQIPSGFQLSGNIADLKIQTNDVLPIYIRNYPAGLHVTEDYSPEGSAGNITRVELSDIVSSVLNIKLPGDSDLFEQTEAVREIDLLTPNDQGGHSVLGSFTAIKSGVRNLSQTPNEFFRENFLTWQSQTKEVRAIQPEWLSYFAVQDVKVKLKAYFSDGTNQTQELAALTSGKMYTMDLSFQRVNSLFEKQVTYYDVWVEDTAASPVRLSFIQRYVLNTDYIENEQFFIFENSLGGIDTVLMTGETKSEKNPKALIGKVDGTEIEYGLDFSVKYNQNTGHINSRGKAAWLQDFFTSTQKYLLSSGTFLPIVVPKSTVKESTREDLPSFNFDFRLSKESKFQNLTRNMDALPANLEITSPDQLFFLEPRLSEFPALALTDTLTFPAMARYTEKWGQITYATVKADLLAAVAGMGYVPADEVSGHIDLSSYALRTELHAHINKPLLDGLTIDNRYLKSNGEKVYAAYADLAYSADRLGGVLAGNYARTDVAESFYDSVNFNAVVTTHGTVSMYSSESGKTGHRLTFNNALADKFKIYNYDQVGQIHKGIWIGGTTQETSLIVDQRNASLWWKGDKVWDAGNSNLNSVDWTASTFHGRSIYLSKSGEVSVNLTDTGEDQKARLVIGSGNTWIQSGASGAANEGNIYFSGYFANNIGDFKVKHSGALRDIYHAGNSNKSDVDWTAKILKTYGDFTSYENAYFIKSVYLEHDKAIQGKNSAGNYGSLLKMGPDNYAHVGNSSVTEGTKLYHKGYAEKLRTESGGLRAYGYLLTTDYIQAQGNLYVDGMAYFRRNTSEMARFIPLSGTYNPYVSFYRSPTGTREGFIQAYSGGMALVADKSKVKIEGKTGIELRRNGSNVIEILSGYAKTTGYHEITSYVKASGGYYLGSKGSDYFGWNGVADVLLKYAGRGSGGRAMAHMTNNVLAFNILNDFSGGTEFYGNTRFRGSVGAETFASGFGGSKWQISNSGDATFDNLTVRKAMNVYELNINKIRSGNGSYWFSDGCKLAYAALSGNGQYYVCKVDIEENSHPFKEGDIVRCQVWTGNGIKYYSGEVNGVDYYANSGRPDTFEIINRTGDIPEVGDELVRIGNVLDTNRQGAVYITSNDNDAPYVDVLDGVTSDNFAGKTKVRLGKLTGITDSELPNITGYGLYAQNVFLKGKIVAKSGKIGHWNISESIHSNDNRVVLRPTHLYAHSAANRLLIGGWNGDGTRPTVRVLGDSTLKYVEMFHSNSTSWGLTGKNNDGNTVFQLGSSNSIAGWVFTPNMFKSPTNASGGYSRMYQGGTQSDFLCTSNGDLSSATGNYVQMYTTSASSWGIVGRKGGRLYFQLGATNQIAGWKFTDQYIRKGTGASSEAGAGLIMSTENIGSGSIYNHSQKLKGFSMTWHKSNNAGHLVMGQIASSGTTLKTGFYGLQMMNHTGSEFFCLSTNADRTGSPEYYNRIAGWAFDSSQIYKGNIHITSSADGLYCSDGTERWKFKPDGSGHVATNNIKWDAAGNVTFSPKVKMSWNGNNLIKVPWNSESWGNAETMTYGSQFFGNYGKDDNAVVRDLTPYDTHRGRHNRWTWLMRGSNTNGWDGGMTINYDFDTTQPYICAFWCKTSNPISSDYGPAMIYFGANGMLANGGDNSSNGNAYFAYKTSLSASNDWYLFVGVIYPKNTPNFSTSDCFTGGIYDKHGKRIYTGAPFKFRDSLADSYRGYFRIGNYRMKSGYAFIQDPQLYVMDGSEPSVNDLLNNMVNSTYIDSAGAYFGTLTASQVNAVDINASSITTGILSAARIATGSLDAAKITAGTITATQIAADAITADKISANAIEADKIKAGAIVADKIAVNAISANNIKANAIEAAKIKAGAIEADKIAVNAITADKIKAGEITVDKLKSDVLTADNINFDNAVGVNMDITGVIKTNHSGGKHLTMNGYSLGTNSGIMQLNHLSADSTYLQTWIQNGRGGSMARFIGGVGANVGSTGTIEIYADVQCTEEMSVARKFNAYQIFENGTKLTSKYLTRVDAELDYASINHSHDYMSNFNSGNLVLTEISSHINASQSHVTACQVGRVVIITGYVTGRYNDNSFRHCFTLPSGIAKPTTTIYDGGQRVGWIEQCNMYLNTSGYLYIQFDSDITTNTSDSAKRHYFTMVYPV